MPSTNQLFRSDGAFVNYRTYILLLFRPYRAKEIDYYPSKNLMRKPYINYSFNCSWLNSLYEFSTMTIPSSTITPIARAIPVNDIILDENPK